MGKSKIAKAGPSTPVRQVRWRTITSGRQSMDKIVKFPPHKKAHIERADGNQSPTWTGSMSELENASFFPDGSPEAYLAMEDPPMQPCRLPRNQVQGNLHTLYGYLMQL